MRKMLACAILALACGSASALPLLFPSERSPGFAFGSIGVNFSFDPFRLACGFDIDAYMYYPSASFGLGGSLGWDSWSPNKHKRADTFIYYLNFINLASDGDGSYALPIRAGIGTWGYLGANGTKDDWGAFGIRASSGIECFAAPIIDETAHYLVDQIGGYWTYRFLGDLGIGYAFPNSTAGYEVKKSIKLFGSVQAGGSATFALPPNSNTSVVYY